MDTLQHVAEQSLCTSSGTPQDPSIILLSSLLGGLVFGLLHGVVLFFPNIKPGLWIHHVAYMGALSLVLVWALRVYFDDAETSGTPGHCQSTISTVKRFMDTHLISDLQHHSSSSSSSSSSSASASSTTQSSQSGGGESNNSNSNGSGWFGPCDASNDSITAFTCTIANFLGGHAQHTINDEDRGDTTILHRGEAICLGAAMTVIVLHVFQFVCKATSSSSSSYLRLITRAGFFIAVVSALLPIGYPLLAHLSSFFVVGQSSSQHSNPPPLASSSSSVFHFLLSSSFSSSSSSWFSLSAIAKSFTIYIFRADIGFILSSATLMASLAPASAWIAADYSSIDEIVQILIFGLAFFHCVWRYQYFIQRIQAFGVLPIVSLLAQKSAIIIFITSWCEVPLNSPSLLLLYIVLDGDNTWTNLRRTQRSATEYFLGDSYSGIMAPAPPSSLSSSSVLSYQSQLMDHEKLLRQWEQRSNRKTARAFSQFSWVCAPSFRRRFHSLGVTSLTLLCIVAFVWSISFAIFGSSSLLSSSSSSSVGGTGSAGHRNSHLITTTCIPVPDMAGEYGIYKHIAPTQPHCEHHSGVIAKSTIAVYNAIGHALRVFFWSSGPSANPSHFTCTFSSSSSSPDKRSSTSGGSKGAAVGDFLCTLTEYSLSISALLTIIFTTILGGLMAIASFLWYVVTFVSATAQGTHVSPNNSDQNTHHHHHHHHYIPTPLESVYYTPPLSPLAESISATDNENNNIKNLFQWDPPLAAYRGYPSPYTILDPFSGSNNMNSSSSSGSGGNGIAPWWCLQIFLAVGGLQLLFHGPPSEGIQRTVRKAWVSLVAFLKHHLLSDGSNRFVASSSNKNRSRFCSCWCGGGSSSSFSKSADAEERTNALLRSRTRARVQEQAEAYLVEDATDLAQDLQLLIPAFVAAPLILGTFAWILIGMTFGDLGFDDDVGSMNTRQQQQQQKKVGAAKGEGGIWGLFSIIPAPVLGISVACFVLTCTTPRHKSTEILRGLVAFSHTVVGALMFLTALFSMRAEMKSFSAVWTTSSSDNSSSTHDSHPGPAAQWHLCSRMELLPPARQTFIAAAFVCLVILGTGSKLVALMSQLRNAKLPPGVAVDDDDDDNNDNDEGEARKKSSVDAKHSSNKPQQDPGSSRAKEVAPREGKGHLTALYHNSYFDMDDTPGTIRGDGGHFAEAMTELFTEDIEDYDDDDEEEYGDVMQDQAAVFALNQRKYYSNGGGQAAGRGRGEVSGVSSLEEFYPNSNYNNYNNRNQHHQHHPQGVAASSSSSGGSSGGRKRAGSSGPMSRSSVFPPQPSPYMPYEDNDDEDDQQYNIREHSIPAPPSTHHHHNQQQQQRYPYQDEEEDEQEAELLHQQYIQQQQQQQKQQQQQQRSSFGLPRGRRGSFGGSPAISSATQFATQQAFAMYQQEQQQQQHEDEDDQSGWGGEVFYEQQQRQRQNNNNNTHFSRGPHQSQYQNVRRR